MSTEASSAGGAAAGVTLRGIGASSGAALGPALLFLRGGGPSADARETSSERAATGMDGVRAALTEAAAELRALTADVRRDVGADEAGILEAQALILEDPTIIARVHVLIDAQHLDGARALAQAAEEQARALEALPDPLWQARAADVRDAANRALRHLVPGWGGDTLPNRIARAGKAVVVVAEDLAPSDTAQLRRESVLGVCTAAGSVTSHAAILARALGIPAVVGLGPSLMGAVVEGDLLALDGAAGVVHVRPDPAVATAFATRAELDRRRDDVTRAELSHWRGRVGQTQDGTRVRLLANVGSVGEARQAADWGAEGIGLLRTEFLFAERETLPDEHEQAALYSEIIARCGSDKAHVVVRTLDAGNDKPLPALAGMTGELAPEANPALGVRGFRLHLAYPQLLDTQLRGIVRAAAATGADVQVMLPMVATVAEVRHGMQALREAERALAYESVRAPQPLPLGIMVETPAAVLQAEELAHEARFFSIGTNDLAQYIMAADRLNPALATLTDARQPAVLLGIAQVVRAAGKAGVPVAVCGEMAGEPALAALLVGLGIGELSMAPARLPAVKRVLASATMETLRQLAAKALAAATVDEVALVLSALQVTDG